MQYNCFALDARKFRNQLLFTVTHRSDLKQPTRCSKYRLPKIARCRKNSKANVRPWCKFMQIIVKCPPPRSLLCRSDFALWSLQVLAANVARHGSSGIASERVNRVAAIVFACRLSCSLRAVNEINYAR